MKLEMLESIEYHKAAVYDCWREIAQLQKLIKDLTEKAKRHENEIAELEHQKVESSLE